jgi:hypothetical protein
MIERSDSRRPSVPGDPHLLAKVLVSVATALEAYSNYSLAGVHLGRCVPVVLNVPIINSLVDLVARLTIVSCCGQ